MAEASLTSIDRRTVGARIKDRPVISRWVREGNCTLPHRTTDAARNHRTTQFFPTVDTPRRDLRTTRAVCIGCPAQADCLAYALTTREPYGIWGGETETERRVTYKLWKQASAGDPELAVLDFAEAHIASKTLRHAA